MVDIFRPKLNILIYLAGYLMPSFLGKFNPVFTQVGQFLFVAFVTLWMYQAAKEMDRFSEIDLPTKWIKTLCTLSLILCMAVIYSQMEFELVSTEQVLIGMAFVLNFFFLIGILINYKAKLELIYFDRPQNHYIGDFISFGLIFVAMYTFPKLLVQMKSARA